MNATLPIHSLSGAVVATAIVTESAVSHEELMTADYVQLSWNSDTGDTLPAGAYITLDGERYSLLEPYTPTRANEAEYQYTPQFQSRIMAWQKHIVPLYTYDTDGTTVKTREMDWNFTGSPADAMYMVQQAIRNETGEQWTVQLADSLPATITISSQSGSIFSLLSDIAGQCETEWWADKATNTLYLSRCQRGTAIALTVGDNVGVPSVTASQDGYYTRFYVFGSTRNVTQDSGASVANSVVNKRLTLDPATYPGGYIDVRPNLQEGDIFTRTLYYDDIYPSSKLTISDVRARLKYRLDSSGNKIQTGEDSEGNPIYEQYAIWYFKIAGFDFDPTTIIPQTNLSAHFEDGQLAGRDFELTYHDKADNTHYTDDAMPFVVEAGDYEITIDESSGTIIPGLAYIIPQDGDKVILYNIKMPAEYTASAQQELAERAQKDIAKMTADNNSYEMDSYPTEFEADDTDLTLGQAVTYTNGDTVLSTRVLMVEKHLDAVCQQRIRVGNALIKGNTQQLKEEMTQATQNIDILAAFNNLSASVSNAYAKVQREMLEGFARIGNMWKFDPDDPTVIYSEYSAYVNGFLSAKGKNPDSGSEVSGATTLAALTDVSITTTPKDKQYLGYDAALDKWRPMDMEASAGIDEAQLAEYLTTNNYAKKADITTALAGYATQEWVNSKNYLTQGTADGRYAYKYGSNASGTWGIGISGNASTATKLQTARTIWGQSFNGTANISGDMNGVGIIYFANGGNLRNNSEDTFSLYTGVDAAGLKVKSLLASGSYATDVAEGCVRASVGIIADSYVQIGSARLLYDSTNNALYVQKSDGTQCGFYATGFVSAKGMNSDAGSATAGLDEQQLEQYLTTHRYATQDWVTGRGYLTASDLSGYATQEWVNSKNYLTQGTADGRYFRKSIDTISDTATDSDDLYGCGIYLNVTGNTGTNSSLPSGYGLLLNFAYQEGNFRTQLYADSSGLRFNYKYDNSVISNWRQLLDADNIGSYALTPSNYTTYTVTKTGGGASGTWGIGISGNASTATKLQTARTIWGQSFNGTANISGDMNGVGIIYFANGGNLRNNSEDTFSLYTGVDAAGLKVKSLLASGSYATDVAEGCVRASVGIIADSYVQIGSARLLYDSTNNALYVQKADGSQCGFYATGFLSSKGLNSDGGSAVAGATTLNGLSDVTISSPVNGQSLVYRNGVWKNEMVSGGGSASVAWSDITGKPTWIPNTDGSGSGIDADLLDGTHKSGLFTAMSYSGSTLSITIGGTRRTATIEAGGVSSVSVSSSSSRNISVTVDGHTDYVNDVYATYSTYADQLRTARTIWGQSFNGGNSISGNLTGIGILYFSNNANIRAIDSSTVGIYTNNNAGGLKVKSLYVGTTYGSSAGDGLLVVNNNGNAVTIGAQNSTFCHIYNSANIPFMFNNTVASTKGDLGTTQFRWATVYAKNALNTSSDLRLKTILQDIPLTVEQVAAAPSFLYRWTKDKDGRAYAGSAAQYWQQALPEAVLKGEDGYLSMEYDRISLAAVITTARTVLDHEQRIRKLEQQLLNAV